MFRAVNQWHVDGVALANNHPLMVAAGPAAGGGLALDGQSIYWGKSDGFVQKTVLGETLSTVPIAAGDTNPWPWRSMKKMSIGPTSVWPARS